MSAPGMHAARSGRCYAVYDVIASGGMATVHVGLLAAPGGFRRHVAFKRLHPQFAADRDVAAMFAEEARLTARISHANVAAMLDVVVLEREILLVMDYVHGESFSHLIRAARRSDKTVPIPIAASILADALHGLHAAHEAKGESGSPLGIVHRDVSPQNLLVGTDGIARVVDFGIAKATDSVQITREGQVRGKIPYMAPEQLRRQPLDRRVDVYAAGVVLWEALTGRRLFHGGNDAILFARVLEDPIPRPSDVDARIPPAMDDVALRALARDPAQRFATALEMALALESAQPRAAPAVVGAWVVELVGDTLRAREQQIARMDADSASDDMVVTKPAIELGASADVAVRFAQASSPMSQPLFGSAPEDAARPGAPRVAKARKGRVLAVVALAAASLAGAIGFASYRKSNVPPVDRSAAITSEPAPPPSAMTILAPPAAATPASPASTAAPAPPPHANTSSSLPVQWCKAYDPRQGIIALKPMRVAKCP